MDSNYGFNQNDMKLRNRRLVLDLVAINQPISRTTLASMTDLSPTSISRIISELIGMNLVHESAERTNEAIKVGRKSILLRLVKNAFYTIGVSIQSNTLWITVMNSLSESIFQKEFDHPGMNMLSPEDIAQLIADDCWKTIAMNGLKQTDIKRIGIAVTGSVNSEEGIILQHMIFPWTHVAFARMVEEKSGYPVDIDNNIKACSIYQYEMNRKKLGATVAYLHLSQYHGFGYILDGKIIRGASNNTGESMGWGADDLSSRYNIHKAFYNDYVDLARKDILKLYEEGDEQAIRITNEAAILINEVTCALDPDQLIIGGYMAHAHREILKKAIEHQEAFFQPLYKPERYLLADDAVWSGAKGAAMIGIKHYQNTILESICQ